MADQPDTTAGAAAGQPSELTNLVSWVPAKDFERSSRFYRGLGFRVPEEPHQRYCEMGDQAFLLQDYYVKAWAENCMLNLFVTDAQAWLGRADAMVAAAPDDFAGVRTKALERQDWGPLLGHIWDPSGVLLNVVEPSP